MCKSGWSAKVLVQRQFPACACSVTQCAKQCATQCANHMRLQCHIMCNVQHKMCKSQQKFWCNGSFLLALAVSRLHCSVIPTHTGAIIAAAPTHHSTSSIILTQTRSLGAPPGLTSSWRPFGPLEFVFRDHFYVSFLNGIFFLENVAFFRYLFFRFVFDFFSSYFFL